MRQHQILIQKSDRRPTTVCQKTPVEYEKTIVQFLMFVRRLRMKKHFGNKIYGCVRLLFGWILVGIPLKREVLRRFLFLIIN